MLRLECEAKQYAWGQPGSRSLVADLAQRGSTASIKPEMPYAELWMGVHPSGPSTILKSGVKLSDWLDANPLAIGPEVYKTHGSKLPYLFKVLSVDTALSIQAHPDKLLAEQLHAERPGDYKDDNHKPEMAVAVRDFEALCGFEALYNIAAAMRSHPELSECVGADLCSLLEHTDHLAGYEQRRLLQRAFTALMTCDSSMYTLQSSRLNERLSNAGEGLTDKDELFLRIYQQYPGDVGTMALYFLNYLQLEPGECMYLPANEPHAYLAGDLVEAMASSDNVIRAGLTPKLRDTQVLCRSLTFHSGLPSLLCGEEIAPGVHKYQPPFDEFQILKLAVSCSGTLDIPCQPSPMMLVVLEAEGQHSLQSVESPLKDAQLEALVSLSRGVVVFVPANTVVKLHSLANAADMSGSEPCSLLAYAATVNDNMFLNSPSRLSETSSHDGVNVESLAAAL